MIEFNKKLIFRKFFLDNTYFFIISLASLSIIVWVIQAVNFLDFVTEDGHGLLVYLNYTLLSLPKIISRLMPFIFFISIFYTINKFEDNNELKIFWIFGTDKKEFLKVVLKYSIIFLIIQHIFSLFLVPSTQNKARTFIQSSSIDFFPSLINEKKFIDTVDKLTIYVEKKEENFYKQIFLKDNEVPGKTKVIYADTGSLVNNNEGRFLNLFNGKIINVNEGNITIFNFKNTTFDLSKYLTKSIVTFKIQEKSTYDILNCFINFHLLKKTSYYHVNNCNDESLGMFHRELFKRLIKPFFYLSLGTILCFLLFFSKENVNFKLYRFYIFILGILIIISSELLLPLSSTNKFFFNFTIVFPFILFILQLIILLKKFNSHTKT